MHPLVRETFRSFSRHGGRVLGGAIAFYALLSIAPMLLIAVQVAGVLASAEVARGTLVEDLARWIGPDGARTVASLLDRAGTGASGPIASAASALVILYGSTRLFGALVHALHAMWDVRARGSGGLRGAAKRQLRKRLLGLLMVLVVSVILLVVVATKALLHAASRAVAGPQTAWHVLESLASFLVTWALFAAIFRLLADVIIDLRDLLLGAAVTALLFAFGTTLIGFWLGHKAVASTFGAAGSIVALLLWVHYSAQIFFLGVAFTGVWAKHRGRPIEPNEHTVRVVVEEDETTA